MQLKIITFIATDIFLLPGGISEINKNVLSTLRQLSANASCRLETLTLYDNRHFKHPRSLTILSKVMFVKQVISCAFGSNFLFFDHVRLAIPLLLIPATLRPKFYIFAHGSESWKRVKLGSKAVMQRADLVIANSSYTALRIRQLTGLSNIVACPLGLPLKFQNMAVFDHMPPPKLLLRAADGVKRPLASRVILLVGRMDAREGKKGHRELIEAMPTILSVYPSTQLLFVGDGSGRLELEKKAANSAAGHQIFFAGHVDDKTLSHIYALSYIYVMPSRQEGFGLVYLEAMRFGLPCIACQDDGGADIVVDGVTGYLVKQPIDQQELTSRILQLLQDRSLASRMGRNGRARLEEQFTSGAYENRLATLLKAVMQ